LIDNNDGLIKDNNGDVVLGGSVVYEAFKDNYSFEAKAGRHFVIAWVDENDNVELDEGDFLGFYPDYVSVSPSAKRDGVDFEVGLLLQLSAETNKSLIEQVRPLIKQLPK
jgi:hypothetical protein